MGTPRRMFARSRPLARGRLRGHGVWIQLLVAPQQLDGPVNDQRRQQPSCPRECTARRASATRRSRKAPALRPARPRRHRVQQLLRRRRRHAPLRLWAGWRHPNAGGLRRRSRRRCTFLGRAAASERPAWTASRAGARGLDLVGRALGQAGLQSSPSVPATPYLRVILRAEVVAVGARIAAAPPLAALLAGPTGHQLAHARPEAHRMRVASSCASIAPQLARSSL